MRRLVGFLLFLCPLLVAAPAGAQDLAGHGGPVRALVRLTGGGMASGGFDQAVILWDPTQGVARQVLRWHGEAVTALAALADGGLASAGEDGRIALWPANPGSAPETVIDLAGSPVTALAATADGRLAAGLRDGRIVLRETGAIRELAGPQAGPVHGLAFLGEALASAGYDGKLLLWEPDGPRLLLQHDAPLNALLALPGGGLAAAAADGSLLLLGADGALLRLAAGVRPLIALAASPDGRLLAAATLGGTVGLWALPGGRLLRELDGPGLPVWSLAFAADGRMLWTGGQDARLRAWAMPQGLPLGPLASVSAAGLASGADPEGAQVFRACQACHALSAAEPPMAGPHLAGLFGRRMGSVPGYPYSARLARGDITWDATSLTDLFTRGTDVVTPGTRMPVQRLSEPAELAALLRFLEQATGAAR
jgi:cytochrome c